MKRSRVWTVVGLCVLCAVALGTAASAQDQNELRNLDPGVVIDQPEPPDWTVPNGGPYAFDFPSDDSIVVASTGFLDAEQVGYFWSVSRGDSVTETFAGPPTVSAFSLDVDVIENFLNSGAFCNWDVIINGVTVDNFTVNEGFVDTVSRSQSFNPIAGPDYTVEIRMTNEVPGGQGSHSLRYAGVGANQIELSESVPATPPVALVLLALVLLAGGAMLYRGGPQVN